MPRAVLVFCFHAFHSRDYGHRTGRLSAKVVIREGIGPLAKWDAAGTVHVRAEAGRPSLLLIISMPVKHLL